MVNVAAVLKAGLLSTQEASKIVGYASSNSYASICAWQSPACIHNPIVASCSFAIS